MTVGSILGGTWSFIRAHPAAIAVWTALYLAVTIVLRLAIGPVVQARMAAVAAAAPGLPPAMPPLGRVFLSWCLLMATVLVLVAAVWRAVLFPERRRAFYLRVGMDEARLLGLLAMALVAGFAIELVLVVALIVLGVIFGLALSPAHLSGGGVPFLVLLVLGFVAAAIWVQVRLSLVGPMTIARGRWAVGEGWELAGGRFWRLLGAYGVVWLLLIALTLLLALPQAGAMIGAIGHPGDPAAQAALAEAQSARMALTPAPVTVLWLLLGGVLGMVMLVAFAALPAVAVAQLIDERAGLR